MGATSADTQREIEEIRKDITSATEELYKRIGRMMDMRVRSQQVKDNPAALGAVAIAVAGLGGVAGARAYVDYRRRQRPEERLKRTVRTAAGELGERWGRAREAIPLELHLGGREGDERDGRQPTIERKDPGMIKKMLWGALVASMVAAGGLVARRLSAAVWRAAMNEDPPSKSI